MNQDSNKPDQPPFEPAVEPGQDLEELQRLKRLIAEAQARGEDPRPLMKRAVLSTIDALAKKVPRTPDDDA